MSPRIRAVRGFTLLELIVTMTVLAILGTAALRTLGTSARLNEKQESGQRARAVSRGSVNRLQNDLRAVPVGGAGGDVMVDTAQASRLVVRVPYAMGLLCDYNVGSRRLTMVVLPFDPAFGNTTEHVGVAVRKSDEQLEWSGTTTPTAGTNATCTGTPRLEIPTGGSVLQVTVPAGGYLDEALRLGEAGGPMRSGAPIMLLKRVRYAFVTTDGRKSLTRALLNESGGVIAGSSEVLAAPFASAAGFAYWRTDHSTIQPSATTMGARAAVYGVQLTLDAGSDQIVREGAQGSSSYLTTVYFQNRVTP